jgi:drug/metabolite transporter (DMT)-like permease
MSFLLNLFHAIRPKTERPRGIFYIIIAMFFFAVMAAISKHMADTYSVFQVVFFRCFFAAIPLLPFIFLQGGFSIFKTKNILGHGWRSLSGTGSMTLYFFSLHLLPLADAVAISFSGSLFITALSAVLLKENVGKHRWGAVIVGFFGVLFIAQPSTAGLSPAALIGLSGALLYGFAMISLRTLGGTEKAITTTAYFTFFSTLFCAIPAALTWKDVTLPDLLVFALSGILAGIGQLFLTRAYQLASPSIVSPFNYTSIIWATLIGFLFWDTLPNLWVGIGSAIVIGSGLYIIHRERLRARSIATPPPAPPAE